MEREDLKKLYESAIKDSKKINDIINLLEQALNILYADGKEGVSNTNDYVYYKLLNYFNIEDGSINSDIISDAILDGIPFDELERNLKNIEEK